MSRFHERVQLDSICNNELGDPEALVTVADRPGVVSHLDGWGEVPQLRLLHLLYDATPSDYVTMIITEARARASSRAATGARRARPRPWLRRARSKTACGGARPCVQVGMLPPTSVPVVLREHRKDQVLM